MKPLVNAPLIREHALARGMVAGYVFNEGSGKRINDVTGQAPGLISSGVIQSSVSGWMGSKQGGALALDGTDDVVALPEYVFDWERTQPFSFAFRVLLANTSDVVHFAYAKADSGGKGIAVCFFNGVSNSSALNLQIFNTFPSNAIQVHTGNGSIAANTWYDCVATYDGTSTAAGCRLYINTINRSLTTVQNSLSASILNDITPWIGGRSDNIYPARARFDYFYAFNRVLTQSEVKALRADPYQMFDRSPASGIWVPSNYAQALTLTAETGVFTVSGQDANLTPALLLDAETGQFTVTGQDAGLIVNQGGQTLNLAPGKPRQIRYSARINGELVTGTYEEIQALILRIAEQEAEKAADEAIKEAKKPKRAPFLRILPGKPVEKTEEVQPERIVAKPLVTEYEDAYRRFLDKLISERLAAQIAAEMDDEEALLLLL